MTYLSCATSQKRSCFLDQRGAWQHATYDPNMKKCKHFSSLFPFYLKPKHVTKIATRCQKVPHEEQNRRPRFRGGRRARDGRCCGYTQHKMNKMSVYQRYSAPTAQAATHTHTKLVHQQRLWQNPPLRPTGKHNGEKELTPPACDSTSAKASPHIYLGSRACTCRSGESNGINASRG